MTLPAAQERQSGPADQRPVRGERSAAEEPGDHGAAAEDRREEELPAGGEDLQPEQGRARPEPVVPLTAALPLHVLVMKHQNGTGRREQSQMTSGTCTVLLPEAIVQQKLQKKAQEKGLFLRCLTNLHFYFLCPSHFSL